MSARLLRALSLSLALALGAGAAEAASTAWILTTDYSTFGRLRAVTAGDPTTVSGDLAVVPGDAVGRQHGGLVYVVGRGGSGVVQVYDPGAGFALLNEFSVGAAANPQDIAFDTAGEAYVPCYDQAVLLRIDPVTGTILGSYSTAAFADADGLPETAWCVADGDRLYIACQKLDRANWYGPSGPGAILVFDMAAEAWVDLDPALPGVQPIVLAGGNPYTRLLIEGSTLSVGCAGWFGLADGGIERVDLDAGASLGYAVTEGQLGGDVLAIEPDGGAWLALVADASFRTSVRRAAAGGVTTLLAGNDWVHADLWLADGRLHVLDRTIGASGLRVIDPVSGADLGGGVIGTGLPPFLFVPAEAAPAAAPVPAVASLQVGPATPNPCNPRAQVALQGRPGAVLAVSVVDVRGRRVASAGVVLDARGQGGYVFRGVDAAGRALPAGVYRVLADDGSARAGTAVTLLK
ncbi:MAG TPA: hypothetical protein PLQ13_07045 [Candidatus Krumholzibacteria bacterium]|nr:hypothetical protein [Candidatus Krumholzibacteria bacterium]